MKMQEDMTMELGSIKNLSLLQLMVKGGYCLSTNLLYLKRKVIDGTATTYLHQIFHQN